MSTTMENPPVEVIDKQVHRQILARMDEFCSQANVPEMFVRQSMQSYCKQQDVEWVRSFNITRRAGLAGLAIIGLKRAETRCMAITGTLVRLFVDARLRTVNSVIEDPEGALEPSVLVIHNFYVTSAAGKPLTGWQAQKVYDVLVARFAANNPTVVCIENFDGMAQAYGAMMAEHIEQHFKFA